MNWTEFLSLLTLAAAAGFTPGPNNTLVATAGLHFGYRRTFPMIAGIFVGFPFMVLCIGLGVGSLFSQSEVFRELLRWVGIAILVYFAWKIATAKPANTGDQTLKPFSFTKMAGFQWINPKGWAMGISISSQFVDPENLIMTASIVASVFVLVGISSASVWAIFGQKMQRFLTSPMKLKVFNWTMAILMILSVLAIATADFT